MMSSSLALVDCAKTGMAPVRVIGSSNSAGTAHKGAWRGEERGESDRVDYCIVAVPRIVCRQTGRDGLIRLAGSEYAPLIAAQYSWASC